MTKIIEGNLITLAQQGKFDIIVHGCNCFATMGAGIAVAIKKAFPEAYKADIKHYPAKRTKSRLGTISGGEVLLPESGKILFVINAYTQYTPGPDFRLYALKDCLWELKELISELQHQAGYGMAGKKIQVGFPKIGAGIGGGDWNQIKPLIESELSDVCDLTFVYFK